MKAQKLTAFFMALGIAIAGVTALSVFSPSAALFRFFVSRTFDAKF